MTLTFCTADAMPQSSWAHGAQVLCECPTLQTQAAAPLWGALLNALLGFLVQRQQSNGGDAAGDDDDAAEEGAGGYASAYARLAHAAKADPDPLPGVNDARGFLATSLSTFSQVSGQSVPANLIMSSLCIAAYHACRCQRFCTELACPVQEVYILPLSVALQVVA